ncbi:hypothetical protein BJQ89_00950 [Arthrobacter sp. ES1]|nr:hypothetical protein [Arthrobacter sp. ES1]
MQRILDFRPACGKESQGGADLPEFLPPQPKPRVFAEAAFPKGPHGFQRLAQGVVLCRPCAWRGEDGRQVAIQLGKSAENAAELPVSVPRVVTGPAPQNLDRGIRHQLVGGNSKCFRADIVIVVAKSAVPDQLPSGHGIFHGCVHRCSRGGFDNVYLIFDFLGSRGSQRMLEAGGHFHHCQLHSIHKSRIAGVRQAVRPAVFFHNGNHHSADGRYVIVVQ